MENKIVEIKNLAEAFSGYAFAAEEMQGTNIPILKIGNIQNHQILNETDSFYDGQISEKLERYVLQKDDFLIAMTGAGSVGRPGKMIDYSYPFLVNQRVAIVRANPQKVNPTFLFYFYSMEYVERYLYGLGIGAGQPNISADDILSLKVAFPPLPTQQKIASILSAYDNLIQNYKKQIEDLQTAASELYKEWFVRFRFPGYQTADFENGIPAGWKVVLASELGEFVRGKNITAEEMQEGTIPVISAGIEPSGFHNQSNVKGVSLTISNSGANAGYLQINYSDIWAADCSYCNSSKYIYFYYELLNNMRVVLFNLQKGAAQPHVYAKDINKMKILLPSTELIGTANKKIKLMHEKIYSLQQQITNLTQQRDLLLPRLMSGKLEVE